MSVWCFVRSGGIFLSGKWFPFFAIPNANIVSIISPEEIVTGVGPVVLPSVLPVEARPRVLLALPPTAESMPPPNRGVELAQPVTVPERVRTARQIERMEDIELMRDWNPRRIHTGTHVAFELSTTTFQHAPAITRRHIRANRIDELIARDPRRSWFGRYVVFTDELEAGPPSPEVEDYVESETDDDSEGIDLRVPALLRLPVADAGLLVEDDEQSATDDDNDGIDLRVPAQFRLPVANTGPRRSARIQQIISGPPAGPRRSARIQQRPTRPAASNAGGCAASRR